MRKRALRGACIALLVGIGLALPGVANAAPPCGSKRVLLVYADTDVPTQLAADLSAEPEVTVIHLFDAHFEPPSFSDLNKYNLVLTWSNLPYADADETGDVMADYQDSGQGFVIPLAFSFAGPGRPDGLNGRWSAGTTRRSHTRPTFGSDRKRSERSTRATPSCRASRR